MDLTVIYANIDRLLRERGLSAHEVSREAGVPDAIRNMKRKLDGSIKGSGITVKTLDAIATQLGVTSDYLRTPPQKPTSGPTGGIRDALIAKLAWLDRERDQALKELESLEETESAVPGRVRRRKVVR